MNFAGENTMAFPPSPTNFKPSLNTGSNLPELMLIASGAAFSKVEPNFFPPKVYEMLEI
ncbi:MAG: hypothetical protein IPL95_13520 [Saprospiraceae bacterium]|nr:hypothetical protein [Saprospiraceae bacterium]